MGLLLLNSPLDYLIAVVLLCVLCSVCFALLCVALYKWTTRERYPVAPRVRPPRAEPVDLAEERYRYCASRDAYLEERQLRRIA